MGLVPLGAPAALACDLRVAAEGAIFTTAFAKIGFSVTRYQEIYAPEWAEGTRAAIPADWAKDYPVEQVWHLQKVPSP